MAELMLPLEEEGWEVLHAVPCPAGGDIDHLVIGPGGVWAINSKYRPRQRISVTPSGVTEGGAAALPGLLERSRLEAEGATTVLSTALQRDITVVPALAYVGVSAVVGKHWLDNVVVMEGSRLVHELRSVPRRLTPQQVTEIYEAARDSRNWWQAREA